MLVWRAVAYYVEVRAVQRQKTIAAPAASGRAFSTVILVYLNVASPSFFSLIAPPRELFINPNVLAAYLVIVLPLSFRYWFGRGKAPVLFSLFLFARHNTDKVPVGHSDVRP